MVPKVSICIPTYNNADSVERLLRSIKQQRFTDYEIVITDDSDNDAIQELVKGFRNVRYYKNKKRLGATANWNVAMSRCRGSMIKIMHHDDWFTGEDSLGRLVSMLEEHSEVNLAFCGTRQVELGQTFDRCISENDVKLIKDDYRNLYLGNTIGAPSATIYRKNVGNYDKNLIWLVDMDFYMNILKSNSEFIYTTEPLISIGISGSQLTEMCRGDQKLNIKEFGYIYDKYQLSDNIKYRKKLIQILLENNASYDEIKKMKISRREYLIAKFQKILSKVKWKLGICKETKK